LITPPQIGEAGLVVPLRQFEGVAGKFFPADRLSGETFARPISNARPISKN